MTQAQDLAYLSQAYTAGALSFRNKFINPLFDIWQRGTSKAGNNYLADRWTVDSAGSAALSQDRVPIAWGAAQFGARVRFGHKTTITAAGDAAAGVALFRQAVEYVDTLTGRVSGSVWLWGTAGRKVGINIAQSFGTGGAPSATVYNTAQVVTLTANPTRYPYSFVLADLAGKILGTNNDDSLHVQFYYTAGTNYATVSGGIGQQTGEFNIALPTIENGYVVTPPEVRPPGLELALCQRFYETGTFTMNFSQGASADWPFGNSSWYSQFQAFKATKRGAISVTGGITQANSNLAGVDARFNATGGNVNIGPTGEAGGITLNMGGTVNSNWARNTGYWYCYVSGNWQVACEL